jgi:hypothetical protein
MHANGTNRVRPGRRLSLRQVVDLQGFSFEAAKGLSADFQATGDKEERARVASAISNLAKGWVSLQDAKREILGKPKAGVRKHAVEQKPKPKPYWEFAEPIDLADEGDTPPAEKSSPADEVKWEMQDMPGYPGAKIYVVTDSPALRAERAKQAPPPVPIPASSPSSPAPNPGPAPSVGPVPNPPAPVPCIQKPAPGHQGPQPSPMIQHAHFPVRLGSDKRV